MSNTADYLLLKRCKEGDNAAQRQFRDTSYYLTIARAVSEEMDRLNMNHVIDQTSLQDLIVSTVGEVYEKYETLTTFGVPLRKAIMFFARARTKEYVSNIRKS